MTTDNRTNEQIVAEALREMPDAGPGDRRDPAMVVAGYAVAALETTGRLVGQPTDEQVEAAAKAIRGVDARAALIADVDLAEYRARAALVAAQSAVPQESSRLPDFFAPKPMPNGYIPVPQEPTEAQVEAAAKALRANEGFMAEVHSALEVSWSEYIARLVLVAAQEAAPQAEPDPYQIVRILHEHQRDTSVVSRVKCACGVTCKDRASHRLHQAELIAHIEVAPVLPSSGVDEDTLARLLCEKNYLSPDGKPTCAACRDKAHEVAEWLKGQGR